MLNDILEKLANWMQEFPESRTDEMARLVRLGIDKGWYLNEVFIFSIVRDLQEGEDLNCFLQDQLLSEWDEYWAMILRLSPDRESLLKEAKLAFENQTYGAAIHMYFSQADGIFYDRFGQNLFARRGEKAKVKFDGHLTDLIARDSLKLLIEQFKDASVFRRMYNEVYKAGFSVTHTDLVKKTDQIENEKDLVIPNRHGVLHGIHKNYGTNLNALKCLSLLLFVMYAIHGEEVYDDIS